MYMPYMRYVFGSQLSCPSSPRAIACGSSLQSCHLHWAFATSCTGNPTWHFHLRNLQHESGSIPNEPNVGLINIPIWSLQKYARHCRTSHQGRLFNGKSRQGMPQLPGSFIDHGEFDATISGEEASKLTRDNGDAMFFLGSKRSELEVRAVFEPSFEVWRSEVWEPTRCDCLIGEWTLLWPTEWTRHCGIHDWNWPGLCSFLICLFTFFSCRHLLWNPVAYQLQRSIMAWGTMWQTTSKATGQRKKHEYLMQYAPDAGLRGWSTRSSIAKIKVGSLSLSFIICKSLCTNAHTIISYIYIYIPPSDTLKYLGGKARHFWEISPLREISSPRGNGESAAMEFLGGGLLEL